MFIVSLQLADTSGKLGRMRMDKRQIVCDEVTTNLGDEDEPDIVTDIVAKEINSGVSATGGTQSEAVGRVLGKLLESKGL